MMKLTKKQTKQSASEGNSLLGKRRSQFTLPPEILLQFDQSHFSTLQYLWDRSRRPKILPNTIDGAPGQDFRDWAQTRQNPLLGNNSSLQRQKTDSQDQDENQLEEGFNQDYRGAERINANSQTQNMDLWQNILKIAPDATKDYIARKWLIRTMKDFFAEITGYDCVRINQWVQAGQTQVDAYHIGILEEKLTSKVTHCFKYEDLQSAAKMIRHLVIRANYRQESEVYDQDYQVGKDIVILLSKYSQEKMDTLLLERGFLIIVLSFVCTKDGMDYNRMRCKKDLERAGRWMKVFVELKFKAMTCLYDLLPPHLTSWLPLKNGKGDFKKNQAMLDFQF